MNERIKRLIKQATERLCVKIWDESAGMYYTETHLKLNQEKFAELIVRECADIVNSLEQHEGPGDCSTADYIKELFGVE